ncbi:kinase and exchange factor for Rac A-like isoform X2 [Chironomus tepperi]|uniref:kinase and exchange factor for Rac A-like isoform X2 n=1 Tax=Chironomus tepperi TaxID=113505 RepID=UPI00391F6A33
MGASSAVRAKSPTEQNDVEQQQHQEEQQPPRLNVQDVENNNNHIFVNPHERFITFVDECDLLNNNTTLINHNYLTVAYTPTSTTTTATALRLNNGISDNNNKNKQQLQQQNQSALTNSINNRILSNTGGDVISNSEKKKMQVKESPKKSPKKQNLNEKIVKENEKKKKKKEKPKAPRAPSGGGNAGGRGRGMAEQDQLMRRPRRKLKDKAEKEGIVFSRTHNHR